LIDIKNEKMIADSVKEILSNYSNYKELARLGRQHVIKNFNWIKIAEEYEKAISKTIEDFKNADI